MGLTQSCEYQIESARNEILHDFGDDLEQFKNVTITNESNKSIIKRSTSAIDTDKILAKAMIEGILKAMICIKARGPKSVKSTTPIRFDGYNLRIFEYLINDEGTVFMTGSDSMTQCDPYLKCLGSEDKELHSLAESILSRLQEKI